MSIAIKVEDLSKSYVISHQARERYRTLREAVSTGASNFVRALGRRTKSQTSEEFWALRDVNFSVEHGERVGIIGRNGAGKSTLLKILSRITEPTRGRVTLAGRVASLLEVGTGFHPELTGRENIYLNGAVLGMTHAEVRRKFDQIVEFAEVEKFLDTPVKRYSSGMYVRLAFAVAAHLEPEILVVDEVLAVGDAQFQKKCLGKMEEVGNSGRTILFVSHNLPTVLRLCPRALLLDQGSLIAGGESARIIDDYLQIRVVSTDKPEPLRNAPRGRGMGQQFRFTGCAVLDSEGRVANRLLYGEPLTIRVDSEGIDALDQVAIAIGLDTHAEMRIATLLSEDSGVLLNYGAGQEVRVTARPRHVMLKPGRYLITLAARRRGQAIDQLSQVVSFEVDSVPWKSTPPPNGTWGTLQVEASWDSSHA